MRILITGGAGFVGSHFVRSALTAQYPSLAGAHLVVLDKLTYAGNLANLEPVIGSPHLEFVPGDIRDATLVRALTARVDEVIHFAAESHVDRSIADASSFVRTNVDGTQVLLDAALQYGVERFLYISTDEVYGSITRGSCDETSPLKPSSPYSASKAAGDLLAQAYHRTHGVPVIVTRSSNNYGPYQYPEKAIPLFVTSLLDGNPVPLYGDGSHRRDWLHADDHCRAVELVRTTGRVGEVYNIGAETELSNIELTQSLLDLLGFTWDAVCHVADRPGHDHRYSVDTTKIRTELGFRPLTPISEGLPQTVAWYRDNRPWWEPLKHAPSGSGRSGAKEA
ncbi:dTDP-glucose 4,6-dehydratase [Phytoactinopolyspora limicola]|uniref:dTDP-glucose 4,6-dehydratase n=1 Tax=Phytoactinopolyspora limicola TaxID=2715536 RepID=UPI001408D203|nr:dTDP-glucose 4,6-dehydratase [Phytoactinopolyspora limicola]